MEAYPGQPNPNATGGSAPALRASLVFRRNDRLKRLIVVCRRTLID
jgi:hypothetical protein